MRAQQQDIASATQQHEAAEKTTTRAGGHDAEKATTRAGDHDAPHAQPLEERKGLERNLTPAPRPTKIPASWRGDVAASERAAPTIILESSEDSCAEGCAAQLDEATDVDTVSTSADSVLDYKAMEADVVGCDPRAAVDKFDEEGGDATEDSDLVAWKQAIDSGMDIRSAKGQKFSRAGEGGKSTEYKLLTNNEDNTKQTISP